VALLPFLQALFGRGAGAGSDRLSVTQGRIALDELTGQDLEAGRLYDAALAGVLPEDCPIEVEGSTVPVSAALQVALFATGRAALLDWAADAASCNREFAGLFRRHGVSVDATIAALAAEPEPKRGAAVGLVYVAFRKLADAHTLRLLSINDGSDRYSFLLASAQAAERWASVRIGDETYFEDSDWQFKQEVRAAGLSPRSERHPKFLPRPAPVRG
jgi:hypothetical protein